MITGIFSMNLKDAANALLLLSPPDAKQTVSAPVKASAKKTAAKKAHAKQGKTQGKKMKKGGGDA